MATVNEKMTAIADAIRNVIGVTTPLTLDDMAIGVGEVYNKGGEEGFASGLEEGKELGYDEFWDNFQNYGNRTDYQVAFSRGFPNEAYNPKYDLQGNVNSVFAMGKITDAKVSILNATDITQMGRYNSVLTRLPELNMMETTVIGSDNNPFLGATKLTDLTMTGVLAKSMIFSACPLSVDSIKSIITCLKDFSGTDSENTYTVTFKTSYFNKLETEGDTAEYNGTPCTWAELIGFKKWNLAKG